jgi:hypothetical protein
LQLIYLKKLQEDRMNRILYTFYFLVICLCLQVNAHAGWASAIEHLIAPAGRKLAPHADDAAKAASASKIDDVSKQPKIPDTKNDINKYPDMQPKDNTRFPSDVSFYLSSRVAAGVSRCMQVNQGGTNQNSICNKQKKDFENCFFEKYNLNQRSKLASDLCGREINF